MTNEQQRIVYLEKLLDDATGAMALLRKDNERLVSERNAAIAVERTWETTMMRVCGEDGPASVAEKFKALVAENAGLKGVLEYVINPDNEPEYHDQGMGCGVEDRGLQRDGYAACYYGWDSAMGRVYSEVIPDALPETPATDAAIAAIRAASRKEGAIFAANRMLAAWDAGFVEDTPENAADIARAILTTIEFMDDAPEGDFDRSFADEMFESIAAQLRQEGANHE